MKKATANVRRSRRKAPVPACRRVPMPPEEFNRRLRLAVCRKSSGAAELMFFRGPKDVGHVEHLRPDETAALAEALTVTGFSFHLRNDEPDRQLRLGL